MYETERVSGILRQMNEMTKMTLNLPGRRYVVEYGVYGAFGVVAHHSAFDVSEQLLVSLHHLSVVGLFWGEGGSRNLFSLVARFY